MATSQSLDLDTDFSTHSTAPNNDNRLNISSLSAASPQEELEQYRKFLEMATETCESAANGDLEARMLNCHASIEMERLADAVNHMLDRPRT
jgi:hypothetical protein